MRRMPLPCLLFPVLIACQPGPSTGAACARTSDCSAPLVCGFGRCREECREQRDCPLGALCLLDPSGAGSCALPSDPDCRAPGSSCPTGLACIGGECVNACMVVTDCPPGSVCIAVGDRTRCERADVAGIDAGSADAGPRDASGADANVAACPFGPLEPVPGVTDEGLSDPSLSDDGLELWWYDGLSGNRWALRSDRFGTFGAPTDQPYLGVHSVELFDDGLAMVAYEDAQASLVQYVRLDRTVPFAAADRAVIGGDLQEPAIDASGLHLVAMMGGATPVTASRTSTSDPFSSVAPITELSALGIHYPALSADGLTLAFEMGGAIHLVTRPAIDGPFGTPARVDSTGPSEDDPHLSRDGLELYVSSTRGGGTRHLWVARRACP